MGAQRVTQGSAGEVIKEMVRCGGKKKKIPQWISFPYWKQVTRGHAHKHRQHTDTQIHKQTDTQANAATQTLTKGGQRGAATC